MNEEIKNKLSTMSLELIDSIQKGVEITGEQTRLFIKEYVAVHIIVHSGYLFALLIASIALFCLSRHLTKVAKDGNATRDRKEVSCVFSYVTLVASIVMFVVNLSRNGVEICKGIWAPRVVIVEGLRSITK